MVCQFRESLRGLFRRGGADYFPRFAIAGGGAGLLIYGGALRWFPLVDGIDSPFFYVAVGGEVVAEIKAGAFGESWQAGYRKG